MKVFRGRLMSYFLVLSTLALGAAITVHQLKPLPFLQGVSSNPAERIGARAQAYQPNARLGYVNVAIGGGGAVTGIYIHPQQRDLVYLRTDVGGFYRWNPANQTWLPLTEQFSRSQMNYYGGEALALDPTNPNILYAAVGKSHWFGPGTLLKSTDRGNTWKKLGLDLPLAKEYRRWVGERLAINPFQPQELLFGSWQDGLWRSTDAGERWSRVSAFPEKVGNVSAIVFDPQRSGVVYAYLEGKGIYASQDGGTRWSYLPGSPRSVLRMAIARSGVLYATGADNPAVAKYENGSWQDISPMSGKLFNAISLHPTNPDELLVSRGEAADPEIFRSTSGGKSWQKLDRTTRSTVSWWTPYMRELAWVAAMAYDPHVRDRVWLVDWYGIWRTDNINAKPTVWQNWQQGHEEVVVFHLVAPPKGALLLSALADVDGFLHDRGLDAFPSRSFGDAGPRFQDTYSIAYSEQNPLRMVRVGGNRFNRTFSGATSDDGGVTWNAFKSFPKNTVPTRVAMSATDPNLFVVTASRDPAIRTMDGGATWKPVVGLPDGMKGPWNLAPQSLVADKVDGSTFYYCHEGKVYRSQDGGATFQVINDRLPSEAQHLIQTVPGQKGEIWVSLGKDGLHRSTDGGRQFDRLPSVEVAYLFDFGQAKPGSSTPTLYLHGKITGQGEGFFRSLDRGKTWTRLGSPERPIGNAPTFLAASRQKFGLVFVGTNGRGIYYGDR